MKREIKFRVWDGKYMDYDIWVNSNGAFGEPDKKYNTPHIEIESYHEKSIVMQYTGLKDKNGKEIYEGDVDKSNNVIMYNEQKCLFCPHYYSEHFKEWNPSSYPMDASWTEIIGNIYENPELLNQ